MEAHLAAEELRSELDALCDERHGKEQQEGEEGDDGEEVDVVKRLLGGEEGTDETQ